MPPATMRGSRCWRETGSRSSQHPSNSACPRQTPDCGCKHAQREGKISAGWRFCSKEFSMAVHYEKRNHVSWLTLSRPEARNAWGEDFNEEITRRCDEIVGPGDQGRGADRR